MQEALLYESLPQNKARCLTCPRRCLIPEGGRGYCFSRWNKAGRLYSLIYGRVSSLSVNPIEKKPVFHFYPGSRWLSLGSLGCNFRCPGCQNWELSYAKPKSFFSREPLPPEELVELARRYGCLGISWTFNEPTIWLEYTIDGAKLAKKQGLFTNYVTNGYITTEALDAIGPYLDVFRVDVKGFSATSYGKTAHIKSFAPILEATQRAKARWGMHIEVVTNVTPGFNDHEKELRGIAAWIRRELGPDTPWHVTRFHPHLKLSHLSPTPIRTLERGQEIGREEGLDYVYIGNVPGHPGENTYCSNCGQLIIQRYVFDLLQYSLREGRCCYCQAIIPGRFQ